MPIFRHLTCTPSYARLFAYLLLRKQINIHTTSCSTDDEAIAPLMPNRHARSPDPHHDDQQPESPSVKRPPSRPVADRLRVEENDTISSSGAEKHEEAQALLFTGRRRFRSRPHPLDPSPPPPPLPAASRGYQSPSSSEYAPVSPPSPPANVLSVPSSSLRSATVAGGRSLDRARARDGRAQQSTVVTPSVAAGAVSARLVSASGPVASGAARWRQAAVAAFSRNRTSMLPGVGRVASFGRRNGRSEAGAGGGAGAGTGAGAVSGGRTGVNANTVAVNRHHRLRNRGSRAEVGQSGETQGLPSRGSRTHREEGGGDDEEGYGEDVGEGGGAGQESSSSATSETEADAADAAGDELFFAIVLILQLVGLWGILKVPVRMPAVAPCRGLMKRIVCAMDRVQCSQR